MWIFWKTFVSESSKKGSRKDPIRFSEALEEQGPFTQQFWETALRQPC